MYMFSRYCPLVFQRVYATTSRVWRVRISPHSCQPLILSMFFFKPFCWVYSGIRLFFIWLNWWCDYLSCLHQHLSRSLTPSRPNNYNVCVSTVRSTTIKKCLLIALWLVVPKFLNDLWNILKRKTWSIIFHFTLAWP